MTLEHELNSAEGQSAIDLKVLLSRHGNEGHFSADILALLQKGQCTREASWLLKAWLESGHQLDELQVRAVYGCFSTAARWETRLHLLQCMPYLPIASEDCDKLYTFLKYQLSDTNKFVRAWAYHGFYELSRQHVTYLGETRQFFQMAMKDESASVKARIRNIHKHDRQMKLLPSPEACSGRH